MREYRKRGENFYPPSFSMVTPTSLKFRILTSEDIIYTFEGIRIADELVEYRYTENVNILEWELSDDTRIMAGFQCQKAEVDLGGRRWVAWFASGIPLNLGPYKFSGLPGLIISVADTTGTWKMEFIGISDDYHKNIVLDQDMPKSMQNISKQEFFKIKQHARDNAFMLFATKENSGYTNLPEKYKRILKDETDRMKEGDNNWIEQYP